MFRPVFGCPLPDHLNVLKREVAIVLEECALFIIEHAMEAEVIALHITFNFLTARIFTVFGQSVTWVTKLLGTHLSIQVHEKVKLSWRDNSSLAVKGLRREKLS